MLEFFSLFLRMALIFTDFQQCTWLLENNLLISEPSEVVGVLVLPTICREFTL